MIGELFTGRIRSSLEFPIQYPESVEEGRVVVSCEFRAGIQQACVTWGGLPPPGTLMYHTFRATLVGSVGAGVGSFDCLLR